MRIFLGKTLLKILKKINKSPFSLCRIFYYQFAPLSLETYFVYSHTWKACAFDRIKLTVSCGLNLEKLTEWVGGKIVIKLILARDLQTF